MMRFICTPSTRCLELARLNHDLHAVVASMASRGWRHGRTSYSTAWHPTHSLICAQVAAEAAAKAKEADAKAAAAEQKAKAAEAKEAAKQAAAQKV